MTGGVEKARRSGSGGLPRLATEACAAHVSAWMVGLSSGESGERQAHGGLTRRGAAVGVTSWPAAASVAGLADVVRRGVVRLAERGVACPGVPNEGICFMTPHAGDAPDAESQSE